jgi:hypothetical protein
VLVMLLVVLAVGLGLTALLWIGSVFAQGFLYTEPSPGIAWQAPAVGGALTVFLMLWCLLNATAAGATASQVPFDALFRAQTVEEYDKRPAAKLWSYSQKKGFPKVVVYDLSMKTGGKTWDYRVAPGQTFKFGEEPPEAGALWDPAQVEAVEIPDRNDKNQKVRFERRPVEKGEKTAFTEFVSADGWVMKAEKNMGLPESGSWGRFILIAFLNGFHLALWFVGLWLVLRFEWLHALILGGVLWLVMTLAVVPMLLNQAGAVAEAPSAAAPRPGEAIASAVSLR